MDDDFKQVLETVEQLHDDNAEEIYEYIKLRLLEELTNITNPYKPT